MMKSKRSGFTMIEVLITAMLTFLILSTFAYFKPSTPTKQNWANFRRELQFEVDRARNLSQTSQVLIEGCEQKDNRAIMIQNRMKSMVYLPEGWAVYYGAISVQSGWVQPGTITLKNLKKKEFKELVFSMGWGDFDLRTP